MAVFRKTWRHEIYIEAATPQEAKDKWEDLNLGRLDREITKGNIQSHAFVEDVSFEDEDYNEV